MKKTFIIFFILLGRQVQSQDIRGAFIQTKKLSGLNYSLTVTLLIDATVNVSRPTIPVNFGDGANGSFSLVSSSNSNGVLVKTYSGTHTYGGPGTYNVSYVDNSRIAGIKNMTTSQTQQVSVGSLIVINSWVNSNSGPYLNYYPTSLGVSGNQVVYTPGAFDSDGDSLSFQMSNCSGTNYYLPTNATIDNSTGTFTFSKDSIGLYAFTFIAKEWRKNTNGIYNLIGSSQLDFVANITPDVGLKEFLRNKTHLSVYPNPCKNELNLTMDEMVFDNRTVEISNAFGQIILKTNVATTINISDLPKGLYVLNILADNISYDKIKFIKE